MQRATKPLCSATPGLGALAVVSLLFSLSLPLRAQDLEPRSLSNAPVGMNNIPAQLEDVILRCLAKSPSERPQSALELSEELAAVGIEKDWIPERAAEWWEANLPVGSGQ